MDKAEKKPDIFGRAVQDLLRIGSAAQSNADQPQHDVGVAFATPTIPQLPTPAFVDAGVPPLRENTTYFAAGTSVEGTLRSDSDVEIVGDFSGEIVSEGKVIIHANTVSSIAARDLELIGSTLTGEVTVSGDVAMDEKSSITGNIRAANLDSAGSIRGNLSISGSVALIGLASVTGDIKASLLSMGNGVKVNGQLDMGLQPEKKTAKKT